MAHARAAQRRFAEAGIRAAAVWGALPRDERRAILSSFSAGELDVVTNCNRLTEGFDEPRVDCVIMARPTRSKLLYAQMVGRGTRLHPDKTDLLVIDIADNSRTQQLPGIQSLFELPMNMNLRGHDALAIEREIDRRSNPAPGHPASRSLRGRQFPDAAQLVQRAARWRAERPTEKQKDVLVRRGIPVPDTLTRGQAAHMIAMVVSAGRRIS